MERLHSGWLLKSPPEKNTQGPWKWFTSKWRRRYFVLYGVRQTNLSLLEASALCTSMLCYYSDEQLTREHGRIDLKQCQEIHSYLQTNTFQHVLAVRTQDEGAERTYCLAAETEQEMIEWEKQLNSVLCLYDSGFDQLSNFNPHELDLDPKYPTLPKGVSTTRRTSFQVQTLGKVPTKVTRSATDINSKPKKRELQRIKDTDENSSSKISPKSKSKIRLSIVNMIQNVGPNSQKRRPSCPMISIPSSILANDLTPGEGGASGSSTPLVLSSSKNILGKNSRYSLRAQTGQYKSSPLLVDMNSGKSDCSSLSDDDKLNASPKSFVWNSEDSLLNTHSHSQDDLDKHSTLKASENNTLSHSYTSRRSRSPLPPIPPRVSRSASMEGWSGSGGTKKYIKRNGGTCAATMGARRIEKVLDTATNSPRAVSWRSDDMSLEEMGESSEEYDSDYNYPTDWDGSESMSSRNDQGKAFGRRGSESENSNRYSVDNASERLSLNCTLDEKDENLEGHYDDHYDTLPGHVMPDSPQQEFGVRKIHLSVVMESTENGKQTYDYLPSDARRNDSLDNSEMTAEVALPLKLAPNPNRLYSPAGMHSKTEFTKRGNSSNSENSSNQLSTSKMHMTMSWVTEGQQFVSECSNDSGDDDVYDVPQFILSEKTDNNDQDDSIYDTLGASRKTSAQNFESAATEFNNSTSLDHSASDSEFYNSHTLRKKTKSAAPIDDEIYDYVKPLNSPESSDQLMANGSKHRSSGIEKDLYDTLPAKISDQTSCENTLPSCEANASYYSSSVGHNGKRRSTGLEKDLYDTLPAITLDRASREVRSRTGSADGFYDTLPCATASRAAEISRGAEVVKQDDLYDALPSASVEAKCSTKTDESQNLKVHRAGSESDDTSSIDDSMTPKAVVEGGLRVESMGNSAEDPRNGSEDNSCGEQIVSIKFTRNTRSFKRRDNSSRKQLDASSLENSTLVIPEFEPRSAELLPDRLNDTAKSKQPLSQYKQRPANCGNINRICKSTNLGMKNNSETETSALGRSTEHITFQAEGNFIDNLRSTGKETSNSDEAIRSTCRNERKVKAVTMEFEKRLSKFNVERSSSVHVVRKKSEKPVVFPKPENRFQAVSATPASSDARAEEDVKKAMEERPLCAESPSNAAATAAELPE